MIRVALFSALLLVAGCGDSAAGESPSSSASGAGGQTTSAGGAGDGGSSAGSASTTSGGSSSGAGNGQAGAGGSAAAGGAGSNAGTSGGSSADRPYANVTAVSVTGAAESYTFAVSVESADIDCSQYADWWDVLGEDGSLVFRRILEHAHTDENGTSDPDAPGNTFTRDGGPVAIGQDEIVVVVAHMNTAGYNGTAMRGSVALGFETAPDIDADFAAGVEELEPQPQSCLF